jgi:hypothetical protein
MPENVSSDLTVTQETDTDLNASQTIQNGSEQTVQEEENQDITMQEHQHEGVPESRIPAKKDATLREFISKMDEHAPIVR